MKNLIENLRTHSDDLRNDIGECEITLMLDAAADALTEIEKVKDTEVELPKPDFGIGRYLSIAGTRDAYTKKQLRDYGDKRAAHARKAAQTELEEQQRINSMGAEREYVLLGKIAQLERARNAALKEEVDQLRLAEEGAKDAFGHVVQQKRDLEAEVKRLGELLAAAYKMIPQQRHAV